MASARVPRRIDAQALSRMLLDPQRASRVAVIDVRDDDHVGGHIRGSIHAPSASLGPRLPGLVRELRDKETVVFHCALSQQRGPAAAARYLQERDADSSESRSQSTHDSASLRAANEQYAASNGRTKVNEFQQDVYVLDLGFSGWQRNYGLDERLTEAYAADIWAED